MSLCVFNDRMNSFRHSQKRGVIRRYEFLKGHPYVEKITKLELDSNANINYELDNKNRKINYKTPSVDMP